MSTETAQRGHFELDPWTGQPLPTAPPNEAEAAAEQAALDVPVGDPVSLGYCPWDDE